MNIFGKTLLILLFLPAVILASCNSFQSTPTVSDAEIMATAISTVSTEFAETQMAIPTATPDLAFLPTISFYTTTPLSGLHPLPTVSFITTTPFASPTPLPTIPSFTPLAFTDPSIPLSERIVYYYPVPPGADPVPEGIVYAVYPFAPAYTDETFTSDTAADLRRALEIILHEDSRRIWGSSDVEIVEVTFRNGHADVVMQGKFLAAGGGQLEAASRQILLTVFANPSVQTATISLNGGTIWNLGVSHPSSTKCDGYVYTRAETVTPSSVIQVEVYADQGWQDTGVTVEVNDQVEVKYIAGAWSINPSSGAVGPEGYAFAPNPLNPIPDAQPGELIGRAWQPLRIGRQVEFTSQSPGCLYLRINDDTLEDNTGHLLVQITVRKP